MTNAAQIITVKLTARAREIISANFVAPHPFCANGGRKAGRGAWTVESDYGRRGTIRLSSAGIKGPRWAVRFVLRAFIEASDMLADDVVFDCETEAQEAFARRAFGRTVEAVERAMIQAR